MGNFAIFIRVSEEGLKENFPGRGTSLLSGGRSCNDPEAGVCLEHSRIATSTVVAGAEQGPEW